LFRSILQSTDAERAEAANAKFVETIRKYHKEVEIIFESV
jgi:hypothetical protein